VARRPLGADVDDAIPRFIRGTKIAASSAARPSMLLPSGSHRPSAFVPSRRCVPP